MKVIAGNTYPVRDQIKALGGKWSALDRLWSVPDDRYTQAMALVNGGAAKAAQYSPGRRKVSNYYAGSHDARGARIDPEEVCEICGKNMYTCGHCVGI